MLVSTDGLSAVASTAEVVDLGALVVDSDFEEVAGDALIACADASDADAVSVEDGG